MDYLSCPKCGDTTLRIEYKRGIEIDHCPKCRGVWLDRSELTKIIKTSIVNYRNNDDLSELDEQTEADLGFGILNALFEFSQPTETPNKKEK